jgi:ribosomal-protein-alanine N-acetyltransferase
VLLRAPETRDEAEFLDLVRRSRALHRPWVSPSATREGFRGYVARNRRDDFKGLLVCRRQDGRIVGVFNLSQIYYGPLKSAYLAYWAGAPYAGQGYMAQGLSLVLRYAFRTLKLHRLEANLQPGNTRSRVLVRAAGFRKEGFSPRYVKIGGRWRDHERWAICAEDLTRSAGRAPTPRPRRRRARS